MVVIYLLAFTLYVTNVYCDFNLTQDEPVGELIFSNIIFRHGDRTPIDPYPTDPYKNASYWPEGWGELTDLGKQQHYQLGKWLRARYQNFLPDKYNASDIYIQSSDVDRTLMSAYSNLAGLYEPDLNTNWNKDIKWTPIPVHTTPEKLDMLVAAKKPCPKYTDQMTKLKNSELMININKKYASLFQFVSTHSGINVTSVDGLEYLYNTLYIEYIKNLTLPGWTRDVFPEPMRNVSAFSFTLPCYTTKLARLKSGPLLLDMLRHFKKKISKRLDPDRKVWIYSGHDTTIANMLQTLKVFQPHSPPYASMILLELREYQGGYYVNLFYKNSTEEPYFLSIPGCTRNCPYEDFVKHTQTVVPNNWEKECNYNYYGGLNEATFRTWNQLSIMTLLTLATLIIIAIIISLRIYKRQDRNRKYLYSSLSTEIL